VTDTEAVVDVVPVEVVAVVDFDDVEDDNVVLVEVVEAVEDPVLVLVVSPAELAELVVVYGGSETWLLKSYRSNLFDPPQNSEKLPLQSILHPVIPSGANSPPFWIESPQSST